MTDQRLPEFEEIHTRLDALEQMIGEQGKVDRALAAIDQARERSATQGLPPLPGVEADQLGLPNPQDTLDRVERILRGSED